MKKSSRYLLTFLPLSLVILAIHVWIFRTWGNGVSPALYTTIDIVLLILFWGGAFFVAPALKDTKGVFVGKFLILTTFQILGFLSVAGALVFLNHPNLHVLTYNMLALFGALLIIQSVLLVRGINRKDEISEE